MGPDEPIAWCITNHTLWA